MKRLPVNLELGVTLSKEQRNILKKRIRKDEEDKTLYYNAREEAEKIKKKLKGL